MEIRETRVDACPPDDHFGGWKVEIVEDGRSISRLWVVDKSMRIGGGQVRIGGISTVGTEEAHRGKGLAGKVMEAALKLMEREGFHASILHGIPDFYHRFGYTVCIPEYETRIATIDAERAKPGHTLRPPVESDLPAIARLYNAENAARNGTVVRDPSTWKGFPRSAGFFMKPGVRVAVDARERLVGYVVYDDDKGRCRASEAGGQGGEVLGSVLRFLAQRAVELRKEDVFLALPPDHPLSLHCRKFGCEARIHYPRNGEFMGLIVNFRPFMENVAEALGRFSETPLPDGRVDFATDKGRCAVQVAERRGSLLEESRFEEEDQVRISQGPLLQLLMGYRSVADLHGTGELLGSAERLDLLSAWFPLRNPCMYWPDRF